MPPIGDAISALQEGRWRDYLEAIHPRLKTDKEQLWKELAAEHPVSVDLITILVTLPSEHARDACHRLLPAIGRLLAITFEEALRVLDFAEALEPSYRHAPARELTPHIRARSNLGIEIGDYLRTQTGRGEAAHRVWANAFAAAAPEVAAHYAIGLMTGNLVDSQLLISLLDFLPLETPTVRSELAAYEGQLAQLLLLSATEVGPVSWSGLASISNLSPTAATYLVDAIDSGNIHAAMAVARSLYRLNAPCFGATAEPIQDIIRRLLTIGVHHQEARQQIDQSIASLMYQDSLRPHAVACLPELCTIQSDVVEMFGETFRELGSHSDDFTMVLSEWLLRSSANFSSIRSLLSLCTTQQAPVGLNGEAFVAHGTESSVKAVRRLLALTHHGPTLCQFIAALAELNEMGDTRFRLAGQMLNLSFAEYPGATEEFLKEKTKACPRTNPAAHVFRSAYADALRWRRVLAKLPQRKELRPSDAESQALRAMKGRVRREIMRVVEEQSVIAQIATKANVAQGRKFASHTQSRAPQITEMAEASHSVELPSSELADPMRGELERRHLLRSAR